MFVTTTQAATEGIDLSAVYLQVTTCIEPSPTSLHYPPSSPLHLFCTLEVPTIIFARFFQIAKDMVVVKIRLIVVDGLLANSGTHNSTIPPPPVNIVYVHNESISIIMRMLSVLFHLEAGYHR